MHTLPPPLDSIDEIDHRLTLPLLLSLFFFFCHTVFFCFSLYSTPITFHLSAPVPRYRFWNNIPAFWEPFSSSLFFLSSVFLVSCCYLIQFLIYTRGWIYNTDPSVVGKPKSSHIKPLCPISQGKTHCPIKSIKLGFSMNKWYSD